MTNSINTFFALAFVSACAVFSATETAEAQLGDLKIASAGYEYYPTAQAKRTSLNPDGADAGFQIFKASLSVPIPLGEHTIFIPGFRYSMLDILQDEGSLARDQTPVDALHAMLVKAAILHYFNESWGMYAAVSGGIASDLAGDLSTDDLVVSGQLLALWTVLPEFTLGAGIGYDRRTGNVGPLPLVAIDWQPTPVLMIRGVLPESLAFRWRTAQWLTLGLEGALEGERYHLSDRPDVEEVEVAYRVVKMGAAATVHWNPWFHTRLYGGAAVARRFEVFVDDDSQGDLKVETGPFAGIELSIGPSGWKFVD
jgi:hypothetical protein